MNIPQIAPADDHAAPIDALSYEEALAALEQTVAALEKEGQALERTLALYEYGVRLAKHCETLLDQAELRVSELSANWEEANDMDLADGD